MSIVFFTLKTRLDLCGLEAILYGYGVHEDNLLRSMKLLITLKPRYWNLTENSYFGMSIKSVAQ